jgi:hypothetical protein
VKGKRKQGREMLRLMHNRSADEKGHHRVKRCGTDGRIWCEKCGKSSNVKRLTQWLLTKCRGNVAGGEGGERKGKGREETDRDKANKKKENKNDVGQKGGTMTKRKNNKTPKGKIRW